MLLMCVLVPCRYAVVSIAGMLAHTTRHCRINIFLGTGVPGTGVLPVVRSSSIPVDTYSTVPVSLYPQFETGGEALLPERASISLPAIYRF